MHSLSQFIKVRSKTGWSQNTSVAVAIGLIMCDNLKGAVYNPLIIPCVGVVVFVWVLLVGLFVFPSSSVCVILCGFCLFFVLLMSVLFFVVGFVCFSFFLCLCCCFLWVLFVCFSFFFLCLCCFLWVFPWSFSHTVAVCSSVFVFVCCLLISHVCLSGGLLFTYI